LPSEADLWRGKGFTKGEGELRPVPQKKRDKHNLKGTPKRATGKTIKNREVNTQNKVFHNRMGTQKHDRTGSGPGQHSTGSFGGGGHAIFGKDIREEKN